VKLKEMPAKENKQRKTILLHLLIPTVELIPKNSYVKSELATVAPYTYPLHFGLVFRTPFTEDMEREP
jgi:hypothetical protein